MIIGGSLVWLKRLKDIDEYVIACIVDVWPQVISRLDGSTKEDRITDRVVALLRKNKAIWKYGYPDLQYKLLEEDSVGDISTKGIIDIAYILEQDFDHYIAYECKRLNTISEEGKRASLAGKYVDEGVMRYVTAQYAENLPFGCMIGYVMDGDTGFAIQQLASAVDKRKKKLNLTTGKINVKLGACVQFETNHNRSGKRSSIAVRHRLFSIL